MDRTKKYITYVLMGIFSIIIIVLIGGLFLVNMMADPFSTMKYDLVNNTLDTIYIKSSDIEIYQNNLQEINIKENVFNIIPPKSNITLYEDHKVGYLGNYTLPNLNYKYDSLTVLLKGKPQIIRMNDKKKCRFSLINDQNVIYTREVQISDLNDFHDKL